MDVSVCIVNYNACDYLRECLRSLYKNVKALSFEVIVVDNHSSDGVVEMLRQ
ncbi:MAG: glycosyltransferase, partial [Chloroflexota bacterium]